MKDIFLWRCLWPGFPLYLFMAALRHKKDAAAIPNADAAPPENP